MNEKKIIFLFIDILILIIVFFYIIDVEMRAVNTCGRYYLMKCSYYNPFSQECVCFGKGYVLNNTMIEERNKFLLGQFEMRESERNKMYEDLQKLNISEYVVQ